MGGREDGWGVAGTKKGCPGQIAKWADARWRGSQVERTLSPRWRCVWMHAMNARRRDEPAPTRERPATDPRQGDPRQGDPRDREATRRMNAARSRGGRGRSPRAL